MEKTKFASSTKRNHRRKYNESKNRTYKRKNIKSRAKEIFESIDENGDGRVSKYEFLKWHRPSLEERFKKLDTNGDGSISFKEFKKNFHAFKKWYIESKVLSIENKPQSKSFAKETKNM